MLTYIYNNSYTVNVNMHIIISIYIYAQIFEIICGCKFYKSDVYIYTYIYIKIDK